MLLMIFLSLLLCPVSTAVGRPRGAPRRETVENPPISPAEQIGRHPTGFI